VGSGVSVVVILGGLAAAAFFAWPQVRLASSGGALARIVLPRFAGSVAVAVRAPDGRNVSVQLRAGRLWPAGTLAAGERLIVDVAVRRPGWASWLVGGTERRSFGVVTPSAAVVARSLRVRNGAQVSVAFDVPVAVVSLGGGRAQRLARPQMRVPVGVTATGVHGAGTILVAAAARTWERLPAPVRVSWFPAAPYAQVVADPAPGSQLAPGGVLTLTFSQPVGQVLGTRRPQLSPATTGSWRLLDANSLAFEPSGLGYGLGTTVRIALPRAVHVAGRPATVLSRTLAWPVPLGSTARLQQLLAQLGYLPLDWKPAADPTTSAQAQLAAVVSPPQGRFFWRYPGTPPELRALWQAGQPNEITRAAVMSFESTHGLPVDGISGPAVWHALLKDSLAGRRITTGYSYVFVHRNVPQSLNLWHDGKVIVTSPGNTGVPAAPTQLGTFPVFEHIPVGTMSGTNPNGSHYHDPGIQYISYFHGGDAIHAFNRASYGTPQSLGCVELPLAAAARVWPYTPIGTLVTIEN